MFWSAFLIGGAATIFAKQVAKPLLHQAVKGKLAIQKAVADAESRARVELEQEAKSALPTAN